MKSKDGFISVGFGEGLDAEPPILDDVRPPVIGSTFDGDYTGP